MLALRAWHLETAGAAVTHVDSCISYKCLTLGFGRQQALTVVTKLKLQWVFGKLSLRRQQFNGNLGTPH